MTRLAGRFDLLPPAPPGSYPVDLLIFQTPENPHTVGPRFAARVLAARGFSVESYAAALPLEEMVTIARELGPPFIGFSCAIPASVVVATALIGRLRAKLEPRTPSRYVLSGHAFRLGAAASARPVAPGIDVVTTLDNFSSLALGAES